MISTVHPSLYLVSFHTACMTQLPSVTILRGNKRGSPSHFLYLQAILHKSNIQVCHDRTLIVC